MTLAREMDLAGDAIRMLRKENWTPDGLAQELYTIFSQYPKVKTGPITVDFGDGSNPVAVDPRNFTDPFGNFIIPNMADSSIDTANYPGHNRDDIGWKQNPLQLDFTDEDQPDTEGEIGQPERFERTRTYAVAQGSITLPGKIVSGGPGDTYILRLYPNGKNNAFGSFLATVTQLDIDSAEALPVDSWGPVFGASQTFQIAITELVETTRGVSGERVVARSVRITKSTSGSSYFTQFPIWM